MSNSYDGPAPKQWCELGRDHQPLAICHRLATALAEVERLRAALRVIESATERGGLHANRALFNVAVEALESRATGPTGDSRDG